MNLTGLVTGIKNKGDANRTIELVTDDNGVVYVYASGARRLSSRFMSLTNLYTLVNIECSDSGGMLVLRDGKYLGDFGGIIRDTDKFVIVADVIKSVKTAIQNSDNKAKLYSLLLIYMQAVDSAGTYDADFERIVGATVKLYVYMLCFLEYDVMAIAKNRANGSALVDFCDRMSGCKVSECMTDVNTYGNEAQAYSVIREIYSEQLDININIL